MKEKAVERKLQNSADYLYKNDNSLLLIKFLFRGSICNQQFLQYVEDNNSKSNLNFFYLKENHEK